ncbi:hypothetical protein EXIGLDRAFT_80769 [Exidia glandulosa HHB12029]|uniref:Uncharacterized protein n=1 Tax=Exidia glandulosa HHB12029 TaxID=1314781 RepID=A0A166AI96_EXIGL|nr:hypothetical protein EXIGLDRAFT_80769 [Exidia glandulosa HHB12029]
MSQISSSVFGLCHPDRPRSIAPRRESNRAIQHSRALINLLAYAQRQYGLDLHHARRDREVALASLPSSTATQASAWVASGWFRRTSSILPSFSPALARVLSRSTRSRRGLAFRPPALVNTLSRHFASELHPAYSCNVQTRTSAVSMRFESSSWRSCLRASPPHRLLQHGTRQPALELVQIYGAHTYFNGLPESDAASRRSTHPRRMFPHFEFPRSSALRRLTLNVNDTLAALELRRNMRTLSFNSTRVLLVELAVSRSAVAPSVTRTRTSAPAIIRIPRRSAYLHEGLHSAPRRAIFICAL